MRTRFFFCLLTVLMIVNLYSGETVNFAGDWTFEEGKSKLDQMGTVFIPIKMSVIQSANDLTVVKTFTTPDQGDMVMEEKLTLDGHECKSEMWNSPRVTKATWSEKGDVLKIVSAITFDNNGQTSVMDLNEEWSLTEEGLLSIKHYSGSEWGERNITMVYAKVQKESEK